MSQLNHHYRSKAARRRDRYRAPRRITISQPCRQSPDDESSGRHLSRNSVNSDQAARSCAGGNLDLLVGQTNDHELGIHQNHHAEETDNFNCTQSNQQKFEKLCDRSSSLHKQPSRVLRCKMCPRTFVDEQIYNDHLKTHKPEDLTCKDCGKVFNQFRNLSAHMRTHTGDLPFQCEHCGKAFAQLRNLKTHKRCHTSEKPYSCDQCDKCFRSSSILKDHKKCHAGSSYVPYFARGKPYSGSTDKLS